MDLTHAVLLAVRTPDFVLEFDQFVRDRTLGQVGQDSEIVEEPTPAKVTAKETFSLSPSSRWCVDGATICGTRFFCTPTALGPDLVPTRIDVYIPDQAQHPAHLRDILGSHASVAMRDSETISQLGISNYISRVLDRCCREDPDWLTRYQELPFGSKICFANIEPDVSKARVFLAPLHDVERQTLSVQTLQKKWRVQVSANDWPSTVDLDNLRLKKQLHDSVSVVNIVGDNGDDTESFIFKSATGAFAHLYHELKFLLTIQPHRNIMPRPLAVVVKKSRFGGKHGVVGFLLPFFSHGSIRDEIPHRVQHGTLTLTEQLRWSRQILSALHHILEEGHTFYSDLRPDNILLCPRAVATTKASTDTLATVAVERLDIVLCDFEQRGNWHEWCAPEVLYAQYIQSLMRHQSATNNHTWRDLVKEYEKSNLELSAAAASVDPAVVNKNPAWFRLSLQSAEKAMIYSFGLLLYCIFEGVHNCRTSIANAYPNESTLEFPHFQRTPHALRQLILDCTVDAPEWEECHISSRQLKTDKSFRPPRLVRRGFKLYPENVTDAEMKKLDRNETEKLVLDTAINWWTSELEKAREFVKTPEWESQVFGARRPRLHEVMDRLKEMEETVDRIRETSYEAVPVG